MDLITEVRCHVFFLNGEVGTLRREFTLASYLGADVDVLVQIDASPWGLGGALFEAGRVQEYIHEPLNATDEEILKHKIGADAGQQ